MHYRLDPWPIDTLGPQLTLRAFEGDVFDVEGRAWAAVAPREIPPSLREVHVVDGKPRLEARLLLQGEGGALLTGGYGAAAVGAVRLCPHGSRQAEFARIKVGRYFLHAGAEPPPGVQHLSPRCPQTGELEYTPAAYDSAQVQGAASELQRLMARAEDALVASLASAVPDEDERRLRGELSSLVLQDGRVRPGRGGRAVLGCIKSLHTDYLGGERQELLPRLRPGERTPVLYFAYPGGEARYTWWVRLSEAPAHSHPLAGVMRLEMHAQGEASDPLPDVVREVARLSGRLLTRLASSPAKDPRAPQNLVPVGALEAQLGRAMGSLDLVVRRIRGHIAAQVGA